MERLFDIGDDRCEHRRVAREYYHTRGGAWGTMYDDDVEYRDIKMCQLTGTECISRYKFDCPRYANAVHLLKEGQNK